MPGVWVPRAVPGNSCHSLRGVRVLLGTGWAPQVSLWGPGGSQPPLTIPVPPALSLGPVTEKWAEDNENPEHSAPGLGAPADRPPRGAAGLGSTGAPLATPRAFTACDPGQETVQMEPTLPGLAPSATPSGPAQDTRQ